MMVSRASTTSSIVSMPLSDLGITLPYHVAPRSSSAGLSAPRYRRTRLRSAADTSPSGHHVSRGEHTERGGGTRPRRVRLMSRSGRYACQAANLLVAGQPSGCRLGLRRAACPRAKHLRPSGDCAYHSPGRSGPPSAAAAGWGRGRQWVSRGGMLSSSSPMHRSLGSPR
jgi:hypothetical protein